MIARRRLQAGYASPFGRTKLSQVLAPAETTLCAPAHKSRAHILPGFRLADEVSAVSD
jgi:hypothetical protein